MGMRFPKTKPIRDKKLFMSYIKDLCEYCSSTATDRHHIRFKSQGGGDEHSNLICLCRDCHIKAHGPDAKKWAEIYRELKDGDGD